MEKLSKIAIYIAIVIGLIFFGMFLFAALPSMIENSTEQWGRILGPQLSEEEIKSMFYEHPSYLAFIQRYPDTGENFDIRNNRYASLTLTVFNYDTNNTLNLHMNWNQHNKKLDVTAECELYLEENRRDQRAEGGLAAGYIKNTQCIEP
jgi:hypothetical protein